MLQQTISFYSIIPACLLLIFGILIHIDNSFLNFVEVILYKSSSRIGVDFYLPMILQNRFVRRCPTRSHKAGNLIHFSPICINSYNLVCIPNYSFQTPYRVVDQWRNDVWFFFEPSSVNHKTTNLIHFPLFWSWILVKYSKSFLFNYIFESLSAACKMLHIYLRHCSCEVTKQTT